MRRRIGILLGGVLLAAAAAVVLLIGPYVRDDLKLDRIAKAVALDWRDFGRGEALERLQYELDHQGIGLHVPDDACVLDEGEDLRVHCAWSVELGVPLTGILVPLSFESDAVVERSDAGS